MTETLKSVIDNQDEAEDTQEGKFLTFSLGEEDYGIKIKYVTEIINMQSITQVPEMPDYVKGIINLRGKIIPVMDVRLRFKKSETLYNERTCTIVIDIGEITIGLIVDKVSDVLDISEENIVPPPSLRSELRNRYIHGIGKVGDEIKLLLDCEKLINDNEIEHMKSAISD